MNFQAYKTLGIDLAKSSTVQEHPLETVVITPDGRRFHYVKAGSGGVAVRAALKLSAAGTVIATAGATDALYGVGVFAIDADSFGFVQTGGYVAEAAVATGSHGIGVALAPSSTGARLGIPADTAAGSLVAAKGRGAYTMGDAADNKGPIFISY